MKAIKKMWRDPWARLFLVAWALLLLGGFFFSESTFPPIRWNSYHAKLLVNWWYFVLPPAIAVGIRLVARGFVRVRSAEDQSSESRLPPDHEEKRAAEAVRERTRRVASPKARWVLAVAGVPVWTALAFGAGMKFYERDYEKRMVAGRYTPGYLSYEYGSFGYRFGWEDGFNRGYEAAVMAAKGWAKEGKTGPSDKWEVFADHENAPDYATTMSAHEANPGKDLHLKSTRFIDTLPEATPSPPGKISSTRRQGP